MGFFSSRTARIIASLILGGFFIYASGHKILNPPDFAHLVFNYKLVPAALINSVAIYMPWLELVAGLAVVTGIGRRGGALGLLFLSAAFVAALGYNLHRGHPTICGCFSTFEESKTMTEADKFWQMKREVAINIGLILLAIQILWSSCPRCGASAWCASSRPTV
jgi:putative oxidoreductase